jgi:hypothetical protein
LPLLALPLLPFICLAISQRSGEAEKSAVAFVLASGKGGASAPPQKRREAAIRSAEGRSIGEAEATDLLPLSLLLLSAIGPFHRSKPAPRIAFCDPCFSVNPRNHKTRANPAQSRGVGVPLHPLK